MTAEGVIDVLIVDDDESDRELISRALGKITPPPATLTLENGLAAIEYLRREGPYRHLSDTPLPRLVFCDMKMPFRNGVEVISTVRMDPRCRKLPIIILSSSDHQIDIDAAKNAGASGYVVKPATYKDFLPRVQDVAQEWLTQSA